MVIFLILIGGLGVPSLLCIAFVFNEVVHNKRMAAVLPPQDKGLLYHQAMEELDDMDRAVGLLPPKPKPALRQLAYPRQTTTDWGRTTSEVLDEFDRTTKRLELAAKYVTVRYGVYSQVGQWVGWSVTDIHHKLAGGWGIPSDAYARNQRGNQLSGCYKLEAGDSITFHKAEYNLRTDVTPTFRYGIYYIEKPWAGMSIEDAHNKLKAHWGIIGNFAYKGSKKIPCNYVIQPGDEIDFHSR